MNILIINHYAGSLTHGMEYRPYYVAHQLITAGHKVSIVGASYSHVRQKQPDFNGYMSHEIIDGIHFYWLRTPSYRGSGLFRIINMLAFIVGLYFKAGYFVKKINPNAVIASSTYPLDIFPAKFIANKSKCLCAFEIHDLWPLSPIHLGNMSKFNPFIFIMQIAEDYMCHNADKIISILPYADRHLITRGMDPKKYYHIPNGIALDDQNKQEGSVKIPQQHTDLLNALKRKNLFLVGYTGAHGLANALDYLINAGIYLINEKIDIILVGKGPEKNRLEQLCKNHSLSNIHFLPPVPKETIPDLLEKFDALFLGWRNSELYEFGISPNKLIDYMYSGKPIIHSINMGNNPVEESGCGITVEAENDSRIADGIRVIKSMTESQRKEMGARGRDYILRNQTYEVLAKKFVEILEK